MNLYKIWQEVNNGYDTYDSAVVAAESQENARLLHPSTGKFFDADNRFERMDWCNPKNVQVEYIGIAKDGTQSGVILASFNAG